MYAHTNRPPIPITLVASAARNASGNSGNLKDTTTWWPQANTYTVICNVTAFTNTGATASTVVTLDQSDDNGTTWVTFARFPAFTTSTATQRINIHNGLEIGGAGVVVETSSGNLNANTLVNRDIRVAWVPSSGNTITFKVTLLANPDGGSY